MSNPKVLFVDHCSRMSGAEIALFHTVTNMREIDPLVLLAESGELERRLIESGIPTHKITLNPRTGTASRNGIGSIRTALFQFYDVARFAKQFRKFVKSEQPDVVQTNSMKAHVLVGVSLIWISQPVIFHIRDRVTTDFMSRAGVLLIRSLVRVVPSSIIANSRSTLATVPNSVRSAVIPSPIVKPDPLKYPRKSHADFVFAIVGRITPWKGQDIAIQAFAKVAERNETQLRIIGGPIFGENDYQDELEKLTVDLGISDRVHFVGHVDDVYAELSSVDCLIHTSVIPEPFGQVIVQGMAMGLPVIAANAGGPTEVIDNDVDGLLYPPGDVDELAAHMARVANNPGDAERLGKNAAGTAQKYTIERIVAEYSDEILELVRVRELTGKRRVRRHLPADISDVPGV